jgi:hypothetical protein
MKLTKRLLAMATALMLAAAVVPFSAFADNSYKVTVRAGSHGTINNGVMVTVPVDNTTSKAVLSDMTLVTEDQRIATSIYCASEAALNPTDPAAGSQTLYYKADGKTLSSNVISNVTSDRVYVVVYDYASNLVPYTIQYVDAATGDQIAPSEIAYAASGTVIAADQNASVDNYTYASNSGSITLDKNSTNNVNADAGAIGKNVITYRYDRQSDVVTTENTVTETTETVTVVGVTTAGGAGTGTGTGTGTTTIPDNTTPQGGASSSTSSSSAGAGSSESSTTIEDSSTPQSAAPASSGMSTQMITGIAAAIIALVAFILILFARKRRKHDDNAQ